MSTGAVHWTWRAEEGIMVPLPRYLPRLRKHLKDGDLLVLEAVDVVQSLADKAFFAELRDIYLTLPGDPAAGVASFDDFRAWCLIARGWYYDRIYAYDSNEARDAILMSLADNVQGFRIIDVTDDAITCRRALSQKLKGGMTPEERRRSRDDALAHAWSIVGDEQQQAIEERKRLAAEKRQAKALALEHHK